jgi:hypothetical protein
MALSGRCPYTVLVKDRQKLGLNCFIMCGPIALLAGAIVD